MLQSHLFSKTTKNFPEGETSKNAQLLIKGGFINKSSAGVYSLLPLGLRVLNKINQIVREEMNALSAEELLFPALIQKKYWQQSGRWDTEVAYKTGEKGELQYSLGWTHEEAAAAVAAHFIQSYKDLPKYVYQIQTKFRAEQRAQAGLLRGREFLMKDLYSFHKDKEDLEDFYQKAIQSYGKIFKRLELNFLFTEAGGGDYTTEYTHEFQVLDPAGEDTIFYCDFCKWAQNKEIAKVKKDDPCPKCKELIKESRAIEVANVFKLGTKFSQDFGVNYSDEHGKKHPVVMGSYGIGLTRILGTLAEVKSDDRGLVWPESVAPFKAHLIQLGDAAVVKKEAQSLYLAIGQKDGIGVLYDERSVSAGEKLNDADLLGMPWRVVVSEKTIAAKKVELKKRSEEEAKMVTPAELKRLLA